MQLLGSAINWPTHEPCYAPSRKILFISAVKPFSGCQQSAHKNITVTVLVSVSVTVRVSLVDFLTVIIWLLYVLPSGE